MAFAKLLSHVPSVPVLGLFFFMESFFSEKREERFTVSLYGMLYDNSMGTESRVVLIMVESAIH